MSTRERQTERLRDEEARVRELQKFSAQMTVQGAANMRWVEIYGISNLLRA